MNILGTFRSTVVNILSQFTVAMLLIQIKFCFGPFMVKCWKKFLIIVSDIKVDVIVCMVSL